MSQAGILNDFEAPTEITFLCNSGSATTVAQEVSVLGNSSISTSGSGNTITITLSSTGFTWNVVTSATNPNILTPENAYITSGVSQVNFVLPATSLVGDTFIVTGYTSFFQIQQNANQQIIFGSTTTTAGVTGSVTSTSAGDHITLVCIVQNLIFKVIDSVGNFTKV